MQFQSSSPITILLTILLSACGGSSGDSSTQTEIPPPTPPPPTEIQSTQTTGVITGFGSVFINGVEYETDSAEVSTDDDDSASESDLQVGMIVTLSGSVNDDGTTGSANAIHYSEQIKGPLESIDLAASSLIILGQTVVFDELTSLDNFILEDLLPGNCLEISGFLNADNNLYATRIEKEDDSCQLKVEGKITLLDTDANTFNLEEIVINYGTAEFIDFVTADLANDLQVKVKGDLSSLIDDVFTISQIKLISPEEDHDDGDRRHLEGIITSFDSTTSFIVNGIDIITDENTEFEHGTVDSLILNVRVKIKGTYNEDGSLLANEIRIHQRTQLKIEGLIQAIDLDAMSLTVHDVTFIISDQAKLKDESDHAERFFNIEDLIIGDFVEIKGFVDNKGNNIATKLKRENESDDEATELKGLVSNIDSPNFMLVEVTVNTTENTLFEGLTGDDIDQLMFFEQLQDGMLVEAKGTMVDGSFIAMKVEIKEDHDDDSTTDDDDDSDVRTEFKGTVDEILDNSLVVSGHIVLINENTEYELDDEDISAEQFWLAVKVGDQIKVKGTMDDEGVITAKSIELEEED